MKKNYKLTPEERQAKIDERANISNEICMNNNNSKLGIGCLSLPLPVVACRPDAPCFKECYAQHGCQSFAGVQGAYYRNFRIYNENPELFFEQVRFKIKVSGLSKVRYFDSGDYPNENFLEETVKIAKEFHEVKFMAFTKKYELVNKYLEQNSLPDNYNIMFSAWDKLWNVPNPHNLPIAYVKFKEDRLTPEIPKNAFHCPGKNSTCSACGLCWNKQVKAVYFDEH